MKPLYSTLLFAASLIGLCACSADEPERIVRDEDGIANFDLRLQAASTRGYGCASTIECNELSFTVFDAKEHTVILPDSIVYAFGDGVMQHYLNLKLEPEREYTIVFYAHNNRSDFSSYSEGKIKIDYAEANTCSEKDDAFCAAYNFKADGERKTVILSSPFGQLNIGTDDLNEDVVRPMLENVSSTLTINSGLYDTYDILNNRVSGEVAKSVTYSNDDFSVNTDFPTLSSGKDYSLLTEVYLLVPIDRSMIEATFSIKNVSVPLLSLNLPATPVQMNCRTEIFGSLITSEQSFRTTIEKPRSEKPDNIPLKKPVAAATSAKASVEKEGASQPGNMANRSVATEAISQPAKINLKLPKGRIETKKSEK